MGDTGARHAADARPVHAPDARTVLDAVAALRAEGIVVAPHVLSRVHARIGTHHETVRDVVDALTDAQRHGFRALPVPLPSAAATIAAGERLEPTPAERAALIALCVGTTQRLDVLLAVADLTADDLATGTMRQCLEIESGRITWRDPALGEWIAGTAAQSESSVAHARLRAYHEAEGDPVRAAWHAARGATSRSPETAAVLLPVARRLAEEGESLAAFHVAVEIFDHAEGDAADEARRIAGTAALCAGLLADSVAWLGSLFPHGSGTERALALAPLVIAETTLRGVLPIIEPGSLRPGPDEHVDRWFGWARTSAMAATLCAERGIDSAMRMWLAEAREADLRAGADGAIRGPAVALCWLLSGDDAEAPTEEETLSYGVAAAVRHGLDGDIEQGLAILARHGAALDDQTDPFLHGFERTPLAEAYRDVAEALLRFWQGDLITARSRLEDAMVQHPIGLPFAGLGAVLARRLDLAIDGGIGAATRSLTDALPTGIRPDALVDRAVEAFLGGRIQDAGEHMQLWHDRGDPGPVLAVTGLEEVGSLGAGQAIEPVDQRRALDLIRRIRTVAPGTWHRGYPEIAEQVRAVRSPFVRGRVEALLGTTCVIRGDHGAGRRHLHTARSLFADAGADAWRTSIELRLARLGEQIERVAGVETMPIPVLDPLAACRTAWSPLLTERELQVAMLIVEGAANRDIADHLNLSVRTVEVHAGRVFAKLDVRGRVELTVLARRTEQHL